MYPSSLYKFKDESYVEMMLRTQKRILVIKDMDVFDLTEFVNKHPGGKEAIAQFNGKRIDDVFFNAKFHMHSLSAEKTLANYKFGYLETSLKDMKKK